jgi:tRNA(fMet)-specific endonuclease VapC
MAHMLDTNVAIHLRDGDPVVTEKIAALAEAVLMSSVTRVELEGGVYRDPAHVQVRRARLDAMLAAIPSSRSITPQPKPMAPSSQAPAIRGESCSIA